MGTGTEPPDDEAVPMDVVFVGGGPAGLAGAIELARLVQKDNENGEDLAARKSMVLASFYAGLAFTRTGGANSAARTSSSCHTAATRVAPAP